METAAPLATAPPPTAPPATAPAASRATRQCLSCGKGGLEPVLSLRATPPANALSATAESARQQPRYPLDLVCCPACGLVQLGHVVSRAALFADYPYATGAAPALVAHFRELAESVCRRLGLAAGSRAVEIGSNDGTLLRALATRGVEVLGVDPAAGVAAAARNSGVPTLTAHFTSELATGMADESGPADVVLAANVLAHVDDPHDVMAGIARLVRPAGCAVIEVAHVVPMVSAGVFELIYHEHLCYFSLHDLVRLAGAHGLAVVDVEEVPTQGGSLRCWLRHAGAPGAPAASARVAALLRREAELGVINGRYLDGFARRVALATARLHDLVAGLASLGRRICGYGASARAVTLVEQAGIGDRIGWIVDDNPLKRGRFVPGAAIPVVGGDRLGPGSADYCVLFAWNFAADIRRRARPFHDAGGSFIVPFPQLSVE